MSLENSSGRGVPNSYGARAPQKIKYKRKSQTAPYQGLAIGYITSHTPSISTVSATNPKPIDYIGTDLYGDYNNGLYISHDDGENWKLLYTFTNSGGDIRRVLPTSDGQILILQNTKLLKSTSFPNPISFEEKFSLSEGQFVEWGLDGNGTKFIAADYGVPHTNSNYMWISLDNGDNWTRYEKNVIHPGNDGGTHFHGVAYDARYDRFWHCMGDNDYRGHYYSDDNGASWNEVPLGKGMIGAAAQATTISATPYGMVLGSDSGINGGMYRIRHQENPSDMKVEMMWRWPNPLTSVRGFAFKSIEDTLRGITFMCWRSDVADNPPFITWTNGINGGIFYEWDGTWSATDNIRNIVVSPTGQIKAWLSRIGEDPLVLTFKDYSLVSTSANPSTEEDTGYIRGGKVTGTTNISMAAGQGATAVDSTIAVGPGCTASSFGAVAIGVDAVAGANDLAIGYNAEVSGTNGIAIGRDALAGGNQAVVVGVSSSSAFDRSVLVGQGIVDAGTQNVLIGYDVDVTSSGTWNVVIGAFADADSSSNVVVGRIAKSQGTRGTAIGAFADTITKGVAIGYNAICDTADSVAIGDSTNTEVASSVAIGPRDLHVQDATKGVILTSPNGTKYRVTVDDAGTLSTAVVA